MFRDDTGQAAKSLYGLSSHASNGPSNGDETSSAGRSVRVCELVAKLALRLAMNKLMLGIVVIVLLAPNGPNSAQKLKTARPLNKPSEIPLEAYMEYRQVIIDTIAACRINHYPFCER